MAVGKFSFQFFTCEAIRETILVLGLLVCSYIRGSLIVSQADIEELWVWTGAIDKDAVSIIER